MNKKRIIESLAFGGQVLIPTVTLGLSFIWGLYYFGNHRDLYLYFQVGGISALIGAFIAVASEYYRLKKYEDRYR